MEKCNFESKWPINAVAKFTADNVTINWEAINKMLKKYKIIALFGKSGAGKDAIQKWLVSNLPNANRIVSCTTRPPRDNEINGIDYYFITPDKFTQKVIDGTMLEATEFNGWFYGTTLNSLEQDKINIGVFNPCAIECILQDSRLNVFPLFVVADDRERLIRSLYREQYPDYKEICRRFLTDEKDFADIDFKYDYYLNYQEKDFSNILRESYIKDFINGQDQIIDFI